MTSLCPVQPLDSGVVGSVTRFIDCQAQALGSNAWQSLSFPGSTFSLVLSGFLTIFIALVGYNLLLGRSLTVRSGTIAMVKIGAVFALATSWPAYRALVYDVAVDGPAEIASDIGGPSAIPGTDGTLVERLDRLDGELAQISILGAGSPNATAEETPPPPFAGFNAFALGGSRILFLVSAIAGLAIARTVAGLMLALGPFFIAFILFESTRSLFEGWVRVLAGASLASAGAMIVLGTELAMLEPWLATALASRQAGEALPSFPAELFVITCAFALIVAGGLVACSRLCQAFRLAPLPRRKDVNADRLPTLANGSGETARLMARHEERGRAAALADSLVSLQLKESRMLAAPTEIAAAMMSSSGFSGREQVTAVPVGRSYSRRSRTRLTASGEKRDWL